MTAWDDVADDGTDPDLLRAVVTSMAVDAAGLANRWSRARRDGASLAEAMQAAVAACPADLDGAGVRAAEVWVRHDVRVTVLGDPGYPRRLIAFDRDDTPLIMARRGLLPPDGPTVAIVGSRRATAYGRGVAAWVAESCGQAGVRVVSGGAVGIDAAAHEAAHATRGGTTVVLGCGHDVPYPSPHATRGGLFERVRDHGGVLLSESLPGQSPKAYRVRARNRIVAGLADVVVVVEGGERSGALLTAGAAAELGIPVFAVPGDVRAPGSVAPHRLLAEGVALCRGPQDILDELAVVASVGDEPAVDPLGLPPAVATALTEHWPRPVAIDDLATLSGTSTGALLAALTRARMAGVIAQTGEGIVLRRQPSARVTPGGR
jgi:DNA processing protein